MKHAPHICRTNHYKKKRHSAKEEQDLATRFRSCLFSEKKTNNGKVKNYALADLKYDLCHGNVSVFVL